MKKPNVLFINPPSIPYHSIIKSFSGTNQISQALAMPMGILYLSSSIKKHSNVGKVGILDYQFHINDAQGYKDIDDFIETIDNKSIDFAP